MTEAKCSGRLTAAMILSGSAIQVTGLGSKQLTVELDHASEETAV
jgi:hypothetical protein